MNSRLIWCWALFALLTLGGCGGGKKSTTFAVNGSASVKSGGSFNAMTEFEITGSGLRNALVVPSLGCNDDYDEVGRVDNAVRIKCKTTGVEIRFTVVDVISGNSFVAVANIPKPDVPYAITAITPTASAKLGATSEFTVTGSNLFSGVVRIEAEGCSNVSTTDVSDDDFLSILKISCVLISSSPKFKVIGLDTDEQIGSNFAVDPAVILALDKVALKATAANMSQDGVDNTFTVNGYFNEATDVTVTSIECTDMKNIVFNANAARLQFTCKPNGLGTKFQILARNVTPTPDTLLAQLYLPIRIGFGFALGTNEFESYVIYVDLDYENAPITVANFLAYVDQKSDGEKSSYFVDTLIHRVMGAQTGVPYSIVQGGAFTSKADITSNTAKTIPATETTPSYPLPPIPIEATSVDFFSHAKGTIAMARRPAPDVDSATSQFFFNVNDNSAYFDKPPDENGYTIFGKIVDAASQTDLEAIFNRPLTPGVDDQGKPITTSVPLENIRITNVVRTM
jgi:cyclophilin family peptidyl-prolyl cis-trans isomerase